MKKILNIQITATYLPNGEDDQTLNRLAHNATNHLFNQGLLTGKTTAEIESWETEIKIQTIENNPE